MTLTLEQILLYVISAVVAIQSSGGLMNWLKTLGQPKPSPPAPGPLPTPAPPRATPLLDLLDTVTTGRPLLNAAVKAAKSILANNPALTEAEASAPIVAALHGDQPPAP